MPVFFFFILECEIVNHGQIPVIAWFMFTNTSSREKTSLLNCSPQTVIILFYAVSADFLS